METVTADPEADPDKRFLTWVDRGSYWTIKIVAVLFLVYAVAIIRDMAASGHGAFGIVFLPVVLLIAWFLWRLKSMILRVGIIVLLIAAGLRTLLQ